MGIPEFVKKAKERGIKPIAGVEIRNGDELLFIGIALNREGFRELNDYLSWHNLNKKKYSLDAIAFKHVVMIYPFEQKKPSELSDYEFAAIRPQQVNRLFTSEYRNCQDKLLVWQPVTFSDEKSWLIHKCLRAIDHSTLLSKLTVGQFADQQQVMLPETRLRDSFQQYPQMIENTLWLLDQCSIDFDFKVSKNKKTYSQTREDDKLLLEKLALDGMLYRYGKNNPTAKERIRHELEIIDGLGFCAYFLIAWDIIHYSMSRGFYHVGRGSGANSIVAYCLRITDVDPIKLDLYFERFLNPKRTSPPDFDIDFSWKDRDEVQDYIFKRYGKNHAALLGATSTFKNNSIFRELGKVFGLPKEEIDLLVNDPGNSYNNNEVVLAITTIGKEIMDFPNHRTIHAGGILVTEEPITYYTALDLPPKGFPTTHWDMYIAEDMGFEKLDILSQRGIGHIKEAVEIILENAGKEIDIHKVDTFFEDEKVRSQLKNGETIGCFYIESPAMRGLLKKLKCDNYISLVAASSIIRPGVAKSGMMKEYIRRFHNPTGFEYIHPIMKEQLSETYGVMVFQEDVLKVAHHFAGLDMADADVLRRAMSGKYRSLREFKLIEEKYFCNCKKLGHSDEMALTVWRQIESFAGYSFSKAHSASYAVESFQSLYLKAHFPLEFMVAVINNFGGFYSHWVYFNEAQRQGATIELPCVNRSIKQSRIIGRTIYMGFVHVQNLESVVIDLIINERTCHGQYLSLLDFIDRLPITKEQLLILIHVGAFRTFGDNKCAMLWESQLYLKKAPVQVNSASMFPIQRKKFELPVLEYSTLSDAYDEIELLGFPVTISMFDMLETSFRGEIQAKDLMQHLGERVRMVGRMVTIKYVWTTRKEIMHFGTFIDSVGEFFDTVHFPPSLKAYPFRGNGIYLIMGKVVEEFGFPSIEVEKMAKLPIKPNPKA
ncbi:MAG TPA: DNA polymerase III subunit alpha [Prolixibacteraceae bacterium]|jgi:DNA polymerase-3 subunit alpha|nr:DNA polymerase III subunit alpha [Prolixibacteraceae bacterium]